MSRHAMEIVEWIEHNRQKMPDGKFNAFNYTQDKIVHELLNCTTIYTTDPLTNALTGVGCGELKDGYFYVYDVLTNHPNALGELLRMFLYNFPAHEIRGAHRSGRVRKFIDIYKLEQRL